MAFFFFFWGGGLPKHSLAILNFMFCQYVTESEKKYIACEFVSKASCFKIFPAIFRGSVYMLKLHP